VIAYDSGEPRLAGRWMIAVAYGAGRKRWTRASLLFDSVLLIHQAAPQTPIGGPESLK
jgi:hypothetical protein